MATPSISFTVASTFARTTLEFPDNLLATASYVGASYFEMKSIQNKKH